VVFSVNFKTLSSVIKVLLLVNELYRFQNIRYNGTNLKMLYKLNFGQ